MLIGYARVSTHDQNLDLQRDALEAAGCARIYEDRLSGAASARPGLAQLKDILRAGDTLVVWRLDRLGRSLKDLIAWVGYLEDREVGLRSLHEAIDTTTPAGKLTFHVFGALAEFERALIRDRTRAGLAAARARGRKGGRRPVLGADKRALAVRLYNERQTPIARICAMMGISKPTLYSYVRAANGVTVGHRPNNDAGTVPKSGAGIVPSGDAGHTLAAGTGAPRHPRGSSAGRRLRNVHAT